MRVITWNVNSLRTRVHRLRELLTETDPDVVCLQETKGTVSDDVHAELADDGYDLHEHAAGGRNGVALCVRRGLAVENVVRGLEAEPDPGEARWIEATVDGTTIASVYVPNGRELASEHFEAKLDFLDAMAMRAGAADGPMVIAGDVNVAPTDDDVWDIEVFQGSTHVSPEERAGLTAVLEAGLVDAFRTVEPEAQVFTWWDYRAGAFHKNLGMRLDLIMVSPDIAERLDTVRMLRDYRKGHKPSDHAPLLAEWDGP